MDLVAEAKTRRYLSYKGKPVSRSRARVVGNESDGEVRGAALFPTYMYMYRLAPCFTYIYIYIHVLYYMGQ